MEVKVLRISVRCYMTYLLQITTSRGYDGGLYCLRVVMIIYYILRVSNHKCRKN